MYLFITQSLDILLTRIEQPYPGGWWTEAERSYKRYDIQGSISNQLYQFDHDIDGGWCDINW
jgi:hypothetical protein